jgi:hypothetical protein
MNYKRLDREKLFICFRFVFFDDENDPSFKVEVSLEYKAVKGGCSEQ